MASTSSSSIWKRWIKPSRIVPLLTLLGAGIANVLSFLSILKLSTPESIIIALLALLAIDGLVERISLLEKIDSKLQNSSTEQNLRKRADLPRVVDQAQFASEICILGVGAHFEVTQHLGFYESKIRDGCKIRVILLNPESSSLETWKLLNKSSVPKKRIESTLEALDELMQKTGVKDKCEVHLSDILFPFSIFATDLQKQSGMIIIEYHAHNVSVDERPHIKLTPSDSHYWFEYYRQQFEAAWSNSTIWKSLNP